MKFVTREILKKCCKSRRLDLFNAFPIVWNISREIALPFAAYWHGEEPLAYSFAFKRTRLPVYVVRRPSLSRFFVHQAKKPTIATLSHYSPAFLLIGPARVRSTERQKGTAAALAVRGRRRCP